jgi:gliding motility-associated-like protein
MKRLIALIAILFTYLTVQAQCVNFTQENFDSFEYSTVCPYIIPGTTYQNSPQTSPGFGPSHSGARHLYLNFVDGYIGPAINRPYTVCVGGTYRLSFYHKDAWGGMNNTTFNIYDGNNVLVHSQTVVWNGSNWNHWVSPELTATTTTLRFELVNNIAYQGNNDMVVDDMLLEICSINESRTLLACELSNPVNLFDLFSNSMPTTGTWTGPAPLANGHLGTYNPSMPAGTYQYTTGASGACGMPQGSVVVQGLTPVNLGPDIHHCNPQAVTLNAGNNHDIYQWSNGATTPTITVSAPGTYSVIAKKMGSNLLQHGDFQGGTTNTANGFTTDYIPGTGGAWGLLSNPGQYAISTNPQLTHNNFSSCGDHTTGTGNMFIANGASVPNTVVWSQTVNVNPNQDYSFSFWAMNVVNDPNVSNLQLYINGAPIGPVNQTSTTPCTWTQINDTWNSGAATQAVLSIVNQSSAQGGNDFAIDDIIFTTYCTYYDTVKVTFSNSTIQASANTTICEGSSVTLTANANSVVPNTTFTYNWNGQGNSGNTLQVSPTQTTNYIVYATDQYGCNTSFKTIVVTIAPKPIPNAGPDQLICLGDTIQLNGTINHSSNSKNWTFVTPGILPAPTVNFLPDATTLNAKVVVNQAGVYQFILGESNQACGTIRDTVTVTVSATQQTVQVSDLTCFENQSGSISVVNNDAVSYSYDNGQTWENTNPKTGLSAGTYTVWSQNQHGCKTSTVVTVQQPAAIVMHVSNDTLICENGTATLTASIGQPNSSYHWGHTTDTGAIQQVQTTAATSYTVKAENAQGCWSEEKTIHVTVRNPLAANISPDVSICPGTSTNLSLSGITGGLAPYVVNWSTNQVGTSITAQPATTTAYTATLTDACESSPVTLTTTVTVLPLPTPTIVSLNPAICEPARFELVCTTDPALIQSVSWFISDGQIFLNQPAIQTQPMPAGNYTVKVITTSPQGCVDSAVFHQFLTVYPLPKADFIWNPNPVKVFDTNVKFKNTSTHASSYDWYIVGASPNYSSEENPAVKYPEGVEGTYDVMLIATTIHGCKDTIIKQVAVQPEVLVFVPNTFTPDGDEFNQNWHISIEGVDVFDFVVSVYNRWGEVIWQSKDVHAAWDGTYNGSIVQDGTYTWVITAKDKNNDNHYRWTGYVNVLR